jgi:hypothetical protein
MADYLSFTKIYEGITDRITTEAELSAVSSRGDITLPINALWDTGAMISAITTETASKLQLIPIDHFEISGIHGTNTMDAVLVSLKLPNKEYMKKLKVIVSDISTDFDMIIGMDVIGYSDFAICNGNSQTQFSFVTPPLNSKIDFSNRG